MTDDEWNQGLAEGLQDWIKDTGAEKTVAWIKELQKDAEATRRILQRIQEEIEGKAKELPPGMASVLFGVPGSISIMPQVYFWAKRYGVSVDEAEEQLVARMTGRDK